VVLENIVERSIIVDKNIDSLIANEVYFLPVLLLHLLPAHGYYFWILLLSCLHPAMKVTTHTHTLQLDIYFA
jgi:hypothetical protein